MTTLDIQDVDVPRLAERVLDGEDIVITREGLPVMKLVRVESQSTGPRQLGQLRGYMTVPDSFFDPLPDDILDAFYGGPVPLVEPGSDKEQR